jgi:predicted phosphoribosyltransferase
LDIFLVRKLGVPDQEELAMGAIASGGTLVLNEEMIQDLGIAKAIIEAGARRELQEIARRERLYRENRPALHVHGRTIILVDDGVATGSTMRAAIAALRRQAPARIVVAVPIAAPETCEELQAEADEVVCAATPEPFYAVGMWYEDFAQTTDAEVRNLLTQAASLQQGKPRPERERGTTDPLGEQRG